MPLKIFYAPYELIVKQSLHAKSPKHVSGALLKVEFNDGIGYTALQTWPHLGEKDLKSHLEDVKTNKAFALNQAALYFAELDKDLRNKEQSAYTDLARIPNYLSMGELSALKQQTSNLLIKWKWPKDTGLITQQMELLRQNISRIDLNFQAIENKDYELINSLNVDYVEDTLEPEKIKHSVAWDQKKPGGEKHIFIVKPIKEATLELALRKQSRVVFTSNMDHPLSQMQALYYASEYYKQNPTQMEACGLNTHHLFESNKYALRIEQDNDILLGTKGIGFGFTEELEKETWIPLV